MARVLADYVTAIGWGVVGAISMAAGLAILLKAVSYTHLTLPTIYSV